jgi:hypothetical protein
MNGFGINFKNFLIFQKNSKLFITCVEILTIIIKKNLTVRFELQTWQIPEFKIMAVSTQLDYPTKTAEACLLFVTIIY